MESLQRAARSAVSAATKVFAADAETVLVELRDAEHTNNSQSLRYIELEGEFAGMDAARRQGEEARAEMTVIHQELDVLESHMAVLEATVREMDVWTREVCGDARRG